MGREPLVVLGNELTSEDLTGHRFFHWESYLFRIDDRFSMVPWYRSIVCIEHRDSTENYHSVYKLKANHFPICLLQVS